MARTVTTLNRGIILAEDAALKAKLSDIEVWDPRAPSTSRQTAVVGYRLPVNVVERKYPYISIDLINIRLATERAHSAQMVKIDYWPSEYATFAEYATANGIEYEIEGTAEAIMWHPYDIYYQIQTYARHAIHDRQMTSQLMGTAYIPDRWGYLDVPEDDSSRWLDRISFQNADFIEGSPENGQRVFSKIYTVAVSAHVAPEKPFVYTQVMTVLATLTDNEDPNVSASWTHVAPEDP